MGTWDDNMLNDNEYPNVTTNAGTNASGSNELLCDDWVDANKSKPPEGAFVLVDGDYFKTMVVAAWVPRDDNKFPWKISTGSEMDKWAEDAVKCWCYLPKPCDT